MLSIGFDASTYIYENVQYNHAVDMTGINLQELFHMLQVEQKLWLFVSYGSLMRLLTRAALLIIVASSKLTKIFQLDALVTLTYRHRQPGA